MTQTPKHVYVPPYTQTIHDTLVKFPDHPLNRSDLDLNTMEADAKEKVMYDFNKRHAQLITRLQDREYEAKLDKHLAVLLNNLGLSFADISLQHYSQQLGLIPKHNRRRLAYSNGFTLLIIAHPNGKSYVSYSICHEDDNFDKLKGRIFAKKRAIDSIVATQDLSGFIEYDLLEKANQDQVAEQRLITSNFIKYKINQAYLKPPVERKTFDVETQLALGIVELRNNLGISPDEELTIDTQFFHLRAYNRSSTLPTYVTRNYMNGNECNLDLISEKGGITALGVVISKPDVETKLVCVFYTLCREDENFSKSLGREYAVRGLFKDSPLNFVYQSTVTDDTQIFPEMINAFNNIGLVVLH